MFRLYLDEVGNDDMSHTDDENNRYLSLTGVAMKISHARDDLSPKLNWIKANVFNHDPDDPIIFHRSDIVRRKKYFHLLNDNTKRDIFDKAIFKLIKVSEYKVITAFVDKKALLKKSEWRRNHPYHFLMEIIVEKYTQFLERRRTIGDVMPEGRRGKPDIKLQEEFERIREDGTYYVSPQRIQSQIRSKNLKFRYKKNNISGLQLCDLIAHPSHMHVRELMGHNVRIGPFSNRVIPILVGEKYDRSATGKINGYGIKWFP